MKELKTTIEVLAFVKGVQETTERGDTIDVRKCLEWKVVKHDGICCNVKATWISGVKHYKSENPMFDKDSEYVIEDTYFQILESQSLRKFCSEICDVIDQVNLNEFKETF